MSSNNNEASTVGAGLAIIGAGFAILAIFLFAVFAFVAVILSALCLIALFTPVKLGKWTLERDEALNFLFRGCIGSWLVPGFVLFCDVIFSIGVDWSYLLHMMGVGYVLGSLGWELLTADSNAAEQQAEVLPPAHQITHQSNNPRPSPWQQQEEEPFRYASWDDDEELPR